MSQFAPGLISNREYWKCIEECTRKIEDQDGRDACCLGCSARAGLRTVFDDVAKAALEKNIPRDVWMYELRSAFETELNLRRVPVAAASAA